MPGPKARTLPLTRRNVLALPAFTLLLATLIYGAAGGNISGTVKDRSGAVVPRGAVTATNTDTGVRQTIAANGAGAYSFRGLPVGHYDVDISSAGFRLYRRAGITVDVNSALVVDAVLDVGESSETVTVKESLVQV